MNKEQWGMKKAAWNSNSQASGTDSRGENRRPSNPEGSRCSKRTESALASFNPLQPGWLRVDFTCKNDLTQ
jgi:hypothetical protein